MARKRVLLIGPFGPGQLPESFARAFERLDHDVFRFDSDRAYFETGAGAQWRFTRRLLRSVYWNRLNQSTLEAVRCVRPHLVLAFKGTYLHPETIRKIRVSLGVPIANYYADNPYCGVPLNPRKSSTQRRDLIDALREYTFVWIWERGMAARLISDGVRAGYLPFGVDPETYHPIAGKQCEAGVARHPVVFIGQHSDKREAHLSNVRSTVSLWGSRWSRASSSFAGRHTIHKGQVFGAAAAALYAQAVVSLNIVDDLNMPGHNMRTFEIPASGGLMLSTYTAEQAELFPEGEAALYYRDPVQIDAQIDRVLKDSALALKIRSTAQALAAKHDYTCRAGAMMAELELSPAGVAGSTSAA